MLNPRFSGPEALASAVHGSLWEGVGEEGGRAPEPPGSHVDLGPWPGCVVVSQQPWPAPCAPVA